MGSLSRRKAVLLRVLLIQTSHTRCRCPGPTKRVAPASAAARARERVAPEPSSRFRARPRSGHARHTRRDAARGLAARRAGSHAWRLRPEGRPCGRPPPLGVEVRRNGRTPNGVHLESGLQQRRERVAADEARGSGDQRRGAASRTWTGSDVTVPLRLACFELHQGCSSIHRSSVSWKSLTKSMGLPSGWSRRRSCMVRRSSVRHCVRPCEGRWPWRRNPGTAESAQVGQPRTRSVRVAEPLKKGLADQRDRGARPSTGFRRWWCRPFREAVQRHVDRVVVRHVPAADGDDQDPVGRSTPPASKRPGHVSRKRRARRPRAART